MAANIPHHHHNSSTYDVSSEASANYSNNNNNNNGGGEVASSYNSQVNMLQQRGPYSGGDNNMPGQSYRWMIRKVQNT